MNTLALYAVLCLSDSCTAYIIAENLTEDTCDSYFTDSGLVEAERLMLYYVPDYKEGMNVTLSCDIE